MSGTVLRIIIAAVLLFHGVGHAMGIVPGLQLPRFEARSGTWFENWSSHSWLLTPLLGDAVSRILCALLYSLALLGFVGASLALMGWLVPHEWWRTLSVASAVISLIAIALYWNALILFFPHKAGAIAVDVAILVALLWANWPSEQDIGF